MKNKCFILLICIVIGLLVFAAVSCSKKLSPFSPGSNDVADEGNGGIVPPIDSPGEGGEITPPIDPPTDNG